MNTKKVVILSIFFMAAGFALSGFILPGDRSFADSNSELEKIRAEQQIMMEKIAGLEAAIAEMQEQKVAAEPAEDNITEDSVLVAYVKDEYTAVNTRTDAGTGFPVVERVPQKSPMVILETKDDWYRVRLESGNIAWVASWVVRVQEE